MASSHALVLLISSMLASSRVASHAHKTPSPSRRGALPRGLLPGPLPLESRAAHDAVVSAANASALEFACARRLEVLRSHVEHGRYDDAVELGFALGSSRARLPADCRADAPHAGVADVVVAAARPLDGGSARRTVTARLPGGGPPLPVARGADRRFGHASALGLPVVGVAVDGAFVKPNL